MTEREKLEQAIAIQESMRGTIPDDVIDKVHKMVSQQSNPGLLFTNRLNLVSSEGDDDEVVDDHRPYYYNNCHGRCLDVSQDLPFRSYYDYCWGWCCYRC